MKIFSLKRMIGLAAIVGVVQYARKQGGFRPMLDGLMNKAKTAANKLDQRDVGSRTTPESSSRTYGEEPSGFGGSAYGDYSSNNPTRRS